MSELQRAEKQPGRKPRRRRGGASRGQEQRQKHVVERAADDRVSGAVCPRCKMVPVKAPQTTCAQCRALDGK